MRVQPVAGALGAEIHDVELRDLTATTLEEVRDVLHEYEVIFFRGADLTTTEQLALAASLGEVNLFPTSRLLGTTEPTVQVIADAPGDKPQADYWHTDVTWTADPPTYAILQADLVPERGGDTLWASTTAAYDALSPTMQELLAGLRVVHDNESFIAGLRTRVSGPEVDALVASLRETYPPVLHPLVRTHPETGRRALFLGGRFMRRIDGMTDTESAPLLRMLVDHIQDPRFHCRWRWTAGDVAIWDERSTNHRSAADHWPQARTMRRVEVAGTRPYFDPDARPRARAAAG